MLRRSLNHLLLPTVISILSASASALCAVNQPSPTASRLLVTEQGASRLHATYETPASLFSLSNASSGDLDSSTAFTLSLPGHPGIPVVTRCLLIPPTGSVRLTDVAADSRVERTLRSVTRPEDGDPVADNLSTGDDGFWPAQPVMIGEPAILRGYRIINVTMFPLQVNQQTGETRYNDHLDFSLRFDAPDGNQIMDVSQPRPSKYVGSILRNLVDNPPDLPRRDDMISGAYLYIAPQVNGVDDALSPLLEWRRREGYTVALAHVAANAAPGDVMQVIRDAYAADPPVEFVTLVGDGAGGSINIASASQYGDWGYTLVDGNDPLSDIALGRISVRTLQSLQRVVGKIVTYESNPNLNNPDWLTQGAVVAGSSENGISEVFVAKYVKRHMLALGYTEVRDWYWNRDGNIGGNQQFLTDAFRWGISLLHYRAFQHMNNLNTDVIDNLQNQDGRWPAVLAISCNTGDFSVWEGQPVDGYTEHFLRSAGGGIGAIGTATSGTNVKFNNMVAGGIWRGIYQDSLFAFGWALNMGKYELWRAFAGLDGNYINFLDWNNLMGDAGNVLWTGAIRVLDADHPATLDLGASRYAVTVNDHETGNPEPNALVCLYQAGVYQTSRYTDANGSAIFAIPADSLQSGTLKFTVTKHNCKAFLSNVNVSQAESAIRVSDWSLTGGDGDGAANPSEHLTLQLHLRNDGHDVPASPLLVSCQSLSNLASVELDTFSFDDVPQPGESIEVSFDLAVTAQARDGDRLPITVSTQAGGSTWFSQVEPVVAAPNLVVRAVFLEGGSINLGETRDLNFEIENIGHQAIPRFNASLTSRDNRLIIWVDQASYESLAPGDSEIAQGQLFRAEARYSIVPGQQIMLDLNVQLDNGVELPMTVALTVGQPADADPFGPDSYGYYCFDSGDTAWEMAPSYNWVEINPNIERHQFEGTDTRLHDPTDDKDTSTAVHLPFSFGYYGHHFDSLTICTNGWAAFGNQSDLADFRNSHIGQALGPDAQLCPWWDNLATVAGSAILTYYDEDNGRFIVEWSGMRRLLDNHQFGAVETFELMLYDSTSMPTADGNGVITFQYFNVTNENSQAHNDVPFCTIGISNLDDSGGLEYTYWSQYPHGARPIRSGMAITFTTSFHLREGIIVGRVVSATDGAAIRNASVTAGLFNVRTDTTGHYLIDAVIGQNYSMTVSAPGFDDTTVGGINVAENDTVVVNFALLHPEFSLSRQQIAVDLEKNQRQDLDLQITNRGNGTLDWTATRAIEGEGTSIGSRRRSIFAAHAVNDQNLLGVARADHNFYVSGNNGGNHPLIYIFDEAGACLDTILQPGELNSPMPDLAWDGQLLWGTGARNVYGFDTSGHVRQQFSGPFPANKGLAWDSDRQLLWIAGAQTGIFGDDRNGGFQRLLRNPRLHVTGLAYWPDDPDGFQLYLTDYVDSVAAPINVYKINVESDSMRFVRTLTPDESGQPCGIDIATPPGADDWTLLTLMNDPDNNHGGDRVDVYQLGVFTGWLSLTPVAGTLEAGQGSHLTLTLDAAMTDTGTWRGQYIFSHNAAGGFTSLPIMLTVHPLGIVTQPEPTLPTECRIEAVWPSPFNAAFTISYQLPKSGPVELSIYDLAGRQIARVLDGFNSAGTHQETVDASLWPSGIYLARLKADGVVRTAKVVGLK